MIETPDADTMHKEFTEVAEQDGSWFVSYWAEIPEANGQGKTPQEAKQSLSEAIALLLEVRREERLRGVPEDAAREVVSVG